MYQTVTRIRDNHQDQHLKANYKPSTCPWCGSQRIAIFLAGMPVYIPELEDELDRSTLASNEDQAEKNSPSWQCTECGAQFFRQGQLRRDKP